MFEDQAVKRDVRGLGERQHPFQSRGDDLGRCQIFAWTRLVVERVRLSVKIELAGLVEEFQGVLEEVVLAVGLGRNVGVLELQFHGLGGRENHVVAVVGAKEPGNLAQLVLLPSARENSGACKPG